MARTGLRRRGIAGVVALWTAVWIAGSGPLPPSRDRAAPDLGHTPRHAAQVAARDVALTASVTVAEARRDLENRIRLLEGPRRDAEAVRRSLRPECRWIGLRWRGDRGETAGYGGKLLSETEREVLRGVASGGWYVGAARPDGAGRLYCPVGLRGRSGLLWGLLSLEPVERAAEAYRRQFGVAAGLQAPGGAPLLLEGGRSRPGREFRAEGLHAQAAVDGTDWHVRATGERRRVPPLRHRDGEWIAKFAKPLDPRRKERLERETGARVLRDDGRGGYVLRLPPNAAMAREALLRSWGARYVERHGIARTNRIPDDPLYVPYQWNMPMIDAENGWRLTTGDPGVVVAVVDTGIDLSHPDLTGQIAPGVNILDPNSPPQDDNGHGTHVAGIIAARSNNGVGVASLDWRGRVMPVKVLDRDGAGSAFDVARGIVWAVDHGAKVVNLSLGQTEDCQYLREAVRYAVDRGVLVVAAMGNDGTDAPEYPAAYPEVLAVTAVDPGGEFAPFSNYGSHAGVAAPGVSIASTFAGGQYAALSGTSMAAPHVAGLAALVWTQNPGLSAAQVRDIVVRSAVDAGPPGRDPQYGYGVVNVSAALRAAHPPRWLWRILPWWPVKDAWNGFAKSTIPRGRG